MIFMNSSASGFPFINFKLKINTRNMERIILMVALNLHIDTSAEWVKFLHRVLEIILKFLKSDILHLLYLKVPLHSSVFSSTTMCEQHLFNAGTVTISKSMYRVKFSTCLSLSLLMCIYVYIYIYTIWSSW
jgi:hypothetical protein